MSSLKKNLFTNVTGTSLEALLIFIRGIIIVKTLSVADYGNSLIAINFYALLELIFFFRTSDIILKYHYESYDSGGPVSLSALYFFSLIVPLCASILVALPIFYFSNNISNYLYSDISIGNLLVLYLPAFILASLNGVTTTALRILGKYKIVVILQLSTSLVSLLLVAYYAFFAKSLSVTGVIFIFSITAVILSLIMLIVSAIEVNKRYGVFKFKPSISALTMSPTELRKVFFGVNITAWLKSGGDIGGVFILGLLTNSNFVAIYGLARQVVRPIGLLQSAVYNVVMPEFMKLLSKSKSKKILKFINKYILVTSVIFLPILIIFNMLSEDIINLFSKPEYLDSAYVATILVATSAMTIIFLPFYPIALKFNLIGIRNWISSIRLFYIAFVAYQGMNPVTLAYANLAGVATVRLLFDSQAYAKLKKTKE
jgi:O-antigen/teichoic acid export membrane protein